MIGGGGPCRRLRQTLLGAFHDSLGRDVDLLTAFDSLRAFVVLLYSYQQSTTESVSFYDCGMTMAKSGSKDHKKASLGFDAELWAA